MRLDEDEGAVDAAQERRVEHRGVGRAAGRQGEDLVDVARGAVEELHAHQPRRGVEGSTVLVQRHPPRAGEVGRDSQARLVLDRPADVPVDAVAQLNLVRGAVPERDDEQLIVAVEQP